MPRMANRIRFEHAYKGDETFSDLTARALRLAEAPNVPEACARLLRLLQDCAEVPPSSAHLHRKQYVGATYPMLALAAHESGMDDAERKVWYELASLPPLSERHAAHILARIDRLEVGG